MNRCLKALLPKKTEALMVYIFILITYTKQEYVEVVEPTDYPRIEFSWFKTSKEMRWLELSKCHNNN